jgi:DNA-binding protein H-NS
VQSLRQSKIEDVVASRMQAQQNMRHWTEKKEKELRNIEELQQKADVTEEEFKVSLHSLTISSADRSAV